MSTLGVDLPLALAFAVLVGRNDGAPLTALTLRPARGRVGWVGAVLVVAILAVPAIWTPRVALTLHEFLVDVQDAMAFGLAAVLLATLCTVGLSVRLGIPTSVTLALVGAASGARLVAGDVDLGHVLRVLALAAAAPVAATLVALGLSALWVHTTWGHRLRSTLGVQRVLGHVALSLAYGANDGQKLLAVAAAVLATDVGRAAAMPWVLSVTAACFSLGLALGLRGSSRDLRSGVVHPKPYQVVLTQWSSSLAVLGGAGAGAPVSMTQSLVGALCGSAPPGEWRRIRWDAARRVGLAWLWTLPLSALLGLALGAALSAVPTT